MMYVGRKLDRLDDTPLSEWEINELLYHHEMFNNMLPFLNEQGNSYHKKIIMEIEKRGGIPGDQGGWDHSSHVIYD